MLVYVLTALNSHRFIYSTVVPSTKCTVCATKDVRFFPSAAHIIHGKNATAKTKPV